MQRWQDELTKHPLNTTVKQFEDALSIEIDISDPILISERARFAKFTKLLRDTLSSLDPDIAPIDILNQIQNQLNGHGALESVKGLVRSKDASLFQTINDQVNPSLSYIAQLRAAAAGLDTKAADSASATLSLESLTSFISKRKDEYKETSNSVQTRLRGAEKRIEEILQRSADAELSIAANLDKALKEINEALTQNRRLLSETLASIQNSARDQINQLYSEQEKFARDRQKNLNDEVSRIISDAEEKHEQILDLYNLVARDSITGGHKRIADREYDSAVFWRRLTTGSILLTGVWIAYSLFGFSPTIEPNKVFWLQIGKTISLTLIFVSFAVYASKQSALHRLNERRARSFFLQVQAFDPFIQSLPSESQAELRKALATRIFGSDESEHDKATLENGHLKTIEKVVEFADKIRGSVGK